MARFWVILAVVAVAFVIYSLVDCAMSDRARIRGPRKAVWILLILVLPVIGALLWFFIGRGRAPSSRRPVMRVIAPDDDPNFIAGLRRNAADDERIRKLEEDFAASADTKGGEVPPPRTPSTDPNDAPDEPRSGGPQTDKPGTDGSGAAGRLDV